MYKRYGINKLITSCGFYGLITIKLACKRFKVK